MLGRIRRGWSHLLWYLNPSRHVYVHAYAFISITCDFWKSYEINLDHCFDRLFMLSWHAKYTKGNQTAFKINSLQRFFSHCRAYVELNPYPRVFSSPCIYETLENDVSSSMQIFNFKLKY